MRLLRLTKLTLGVFLILGFLVTSLKAQTVKKVLLAVNIDNPDYVFVRKVFKEELEAEARKIGLDIKFMVLDSKGDKEAFISRLKEMEPEADLIFVPGTPNAMLIKAAGIKKPVIFSAVANPLAAKLVDNLNAPGTNFTGSHCAVPAERQLKAILLVLPNVKTIGILYNPDDPAPASQVTSWKEAIATQGLKAKEFFIPTEVNSAEGLAEATKPMIGKVDVIVTTSDAKVSPYGEGMIRVANENKIPTFASLKQLVPKGALISLGFDFAEGARLNVRQAIDILKGKSPKDIPVNTFAEYKLTINNKTAKEIGIKIPLKVLKVTSEVFGSEK